MKLGLGQSYEEVEYLPRKIRAYIDLTKPASSVGVGLGYLIVSLFYFVYTGEPVEVFTVLYVSLTMFLAHSASQALNMSEDAEMDAATPHKQNRPIPSGVVSVEEARAIAFLLAAFALGRGFMVNWRFGVFVSVLLFMGIFYSLEPLRMKESLFSIPWQAVSRGLFVFPAVWAAYGDPLAVEAWVLGLFLFFYVLGFQNSADIVDREVDEEFGVRTWVVEFGVENTVYIALACTGAMMMVIGTAVFYGLLPPRLLILVAIIPFCLYMIWLMWYKPHEISEITSNHPAWLYFYMGLVATVSMPLVVEVMHG